MSRYAKTLVALIPVIIVGLDNLSTAMSDERVTQGEWIALAVVVLTALGVYAIPNTPPAGERADPRMSEQGQVSVYAAVIVVLLVVLILVSTGRI